MIKLKKKLEIFILTMILIISSFGFLGNNSAKAYDGEKYNMYIESVNMYFKDRNHVCGEVKIHDESPSQDYAVRWSFSKDKETWYVARGFSPAQGNMEDWCPPEYGTYYIKVEMMDTTTQKLCDVKKYILEYNPMIQGICQMPNPRDDGGYLIGIESYDNPDGKYSYEMQILDCTLLAEGKDAWIYTTGQCGSDSNYLWTVWQPQYGYYWTLFRIYDTKKNKLVDEKCYGFANIDDPYNSGIITQPDNPWLFEEEPLGDYPEDYQENDICVAFGHDWVYEENVIHHEAEYEEQTVIDYREEWVTVTICNQCGEEIDDPKEHMKNSGTTRINVGTEEEPWWIEVPNCSSCHEEYVKRMVPYERTEQVLVKEAWDEIISYWFCMRCFLRADSID